MFGMFNKLTIILAAVLALALGGGWLLYQKKQSDLEAEQARNSILESVNEQNEKTIERIRQQNAMQIQELVSLQTRLTDAEQYNNQLRAILSNHDLTKLAEEKPGLIEKRMNDGTKEVFDSIEQFTNSR